jgi:hypothetical protein
LGYIPWAFRPPFIPSSPASIEAMLHLESRGRELFDPLSSHPLHHWRPPLRRILRRPCLLPRLCFTTMSSLARRSTALGPSSRLVTKRQRVPVRSRMR